jgi:hypothetical protein
MPAVSARQRRESVRAHHDAIKRLLSCVVQTHITTQAPLPATAEVFPDALALVLFNGAPATLQGSIALLLDVSQHFRVVTVDAPRSIRVEVISYVYAIMTRDRVELVSYQWHPHGEGDTDLPHVHIGPAMSRHDSVVRTGEAHKIHLPTGEVSLADVLRLAITELEVEPRREDWDAILSRSGAQR